MTDRLQVILQREGITAAKFASTLGVQPSALSHLLSGRNKPSYDFITRFIMAYPAYNVEWLLVGKQPMLKEDLTQQENGAPTATTIDEPQTLFIATANSADSAPQAIPQPLPQSSIPTHTPQPSNANSATLPEVPQQSNTSSVTPVEAPHSGSQGTPTPAAPQPNRPVAKSPKKVIILYDDHTFESFEYI